MGRITALQHLLIQEGFAEDFFGVAVQGFQQAVFAARERGPLVLAGHIAAFIIKVQHPGIFKCRGARRLGPAIQGNAAQNRFNTHAQFNHAERLG
ncbi:hypothetical protein PFLmoz3_05715 [Pseudomonas fluorescens]|uniref:Uncharacterized protein n=1 Tax=Pseudomonas fluorescens TaxID=294 RepID=A0A109LBH2_PSEFL|nr:hypothetical protein PFLmoz3_05715 [Pseudomonas fluorescens]